MGIFDRHKGKSVARAPQVSSPVATILAGYDPNAELGPEQAAGLGERLRAIYETDHAAYANLLSALRKLEDEAGNVRGKHYTEWVPTLDRLRSQKADDEAMPLLLECIDAAERAARVNGMEPAPGYTTRAAIICRRHGDYAREIELIERWFSRCPPPYGSKTLAKRLQESRALEARRKAVG